MKSIYQWEGSEYEQRKRSSSFSKRRLSKRPNSYVSAIDNSVIAEIDSSLVGFLPKELWLAILVNYGLSAEDLVNLELACKWFNICWGEGQCG